MGGGVCTSEPWVNQCFRLWNWLSYFCLGGLIKRYNPSGIKPIVIVVMGVVNLLFQMRYVPYVGKMSCEFFYSSVIVIIFSAILFIWLMDIKIKRNSLINELSRLFLPVYSVHYFIAVMFSDSLWRMGALAPIYNFVAVSLISVSISFLIMKLPYAGKLFRI